MANKIIKAQMKQRRDTKANWAAQNPVLLAGELGIVSDDPNLYKVGDGVTAWNALPFRGFNGTVVNETGTSETAVMSQAAVTREINASRDRIEGAVFYKKYEADAFSIVGYIGKTGGLTPNAGWHATDFLEATNISKVRAFNLEFSNQYIAVLAFYDISKRLISIVSNVGSGLTEYEAEVPENAVYFRATSTDKIAGPSLEAVYKVNNIEKINEFSEQMAPMSSSIDQIEEKLITETIEYGIEDGEWYSGSYAAKGLGQYYFNDNDPVSFNQLRLRDIDLGANKSVEYRIYVANKSKILVNGTPISDSTHTLIKHGVLQKAGEGFLDYNIGLSAPVTIHPGSAVVIYLIGNEPSKLITGRLPEGVEDSNLLIFNLSPSWTGSWYTGTIGQSYYTESLHVAQVPVFVPRSEYENTAASILDATLKIVPTAVSESLANGLEIVIPDTLYAFEGLELNIWNDTISRAEDGGLMSPLNYSVRWQCQKGSVTQRGFRFTPSAADVGQTACNCYIYDVRGVLIKSKAFTIKVLSKNALSSAKFIAYFGDSLGYGVADALHGNFNDPDIFGGVAPTMVGTRGTAVKYEAVGGYGWANYATLGDAGYRIKVSNIGALSIGARYTDTTGKGFEIKEINITEGSGNVLLYKWYSDGQHGYGDLALPTGTLTKISGAGDATVKYSDAFQESTNPLWNASTNKLDVAQYKSLCGLQASQKIDAVSFQFGINDDELADDTDRLYSYITALYEAFTNDNPDCKFIIGLTTTSGNTIDGSGANYGASNNWKQYHDRVYRIKQYYMSLLEDKDLPNLRIATPNLYLDRYYGYARGTRPVSARCTESEMYHTNYVHPDSNGYAQMADAYTAAFTAVLTED